MGNILEVTNIAGISWELVRKWNRGTSEQILNFNKIPRRPMFTFKVVDTSSGKRVSEFYFVAGDASSILLMH